MANTWYVAPDATTVPGVTVVATGTANYGTDWAHAGKWSDFNATGGVYKTKFASGDTIVLLGGKYLLTAASGGWVPLNNAFATGTVTGQTVGGNHAYVVFAGSRDNPWPFGGDSAATSVGQTFMQLQTGTSSWTFNFVRFKDMQYDITTSSNGTSPNLGTVTFNDCIATNVAGGLCYTQTKTDGQLAVYYNRCKVLGYSRGNARVWGPYTFTDTVLDSENQATAANRASAASTSGAHSMDALPGFQVATSPSSATRCVARNNAAGSSGTGYSQGDGFICEENAGTFTGVDLLTYGNGDRGVDLKSAGTVLRHTSWGDGYSIGHHLDLDPLNIYQAVYYTGARTPGSTTPNVCVQSSGLTVLFQSALVCLPTAAQVANNPYALTTGTDDPSKFQSSIYGAYHRGDVRLNDVQAVYGATAGATEQQGYAATADPARVAAIPGLTPGNSYNLKVRAVAQDGSASAYTSTVAYTMDAATTGDSTGPAAPTGLTVTGTTASTATMSWTKVTQDAGTQFQGYMFRVTFPGDSGPIYVMPGKTASPVTFSGLKPATAYTFAVAVFDSNGNIGTFSSNVTATTASGTADTNTPSVPLSPQVASGWISHPTTAGLSWSAPASGTVAYYEVADNAGNVLVRCLPIPSTGTQASYTKTNVTVNTV